MAKELTAITRDRCKTGHGLDLPRRVIAIEVRQLDVHEHEIGVFQARLDDALSAIHGLDHGVSGSGEEIAQDGSQVLLVLDDKNAFAHAALAATAARMGSSMRNVEPRPIVDSIQMRPPCISTISLAMARPSPVPPLARVFELSTWRNFSKTRSHSSAGIPGPVSLTLTAKWPFAAPAVMRTSPASVNLMALPTRLSSTWVRRCSSPRPMGRDFATSVLSASFLFWARDSVAERTVSTTLSMAYSAMLRANWPDSILAMSSTVLMRPKRCLPLERMRVSASKDFWPNGS